MPSGSERTARRSGAAAKAATRKSVGASRSPGRQQPGRIILVSNRLPITIRVEHGELAIDRSSGGLATGLSGFHDRGQSVWIGWPGESWRLTAGPGPSRRAGKGAPDRQLRSLRCDLHSTALES